MSRADRSTCLDRALLGLIGSGIGASRSPAMHEAEGAQHGMRLFYQLLNVDDVNGAAAALPDILRAVELAGFAGVNITHPFKQSVIPLLDTLSEDATALGAVNTIVFRNGRRYGYNTDWWGFGQSFSRGLPSVVCNNVAMLGAGGAGAAVAYALLKDGVQSLAIIDADQQRATQLAATLSGLFGPSRASAPTDINATIQAAQGIVHCTPTGMAAHPGLPLPRSLLRPELWVADIVYFPLQTELLRVAAEIGCKTLDGGGMAVFQAAAAFELFTGFAANTERMLQHFASETMKLEARHFQARSERL